jgi:hypothetical protein
MTILMQIFVIRLQTQSSTCTKALILMKILVGQKFKDQTMVGLGNKFP